jgi:hypothetical protein
VDGLFKSGGTFFEPFPVSKLYSTSQKDKDMFTLFGRRNRLEVSPIIASKLGELVHVACAAAQEHLCVGKVLLSFLALTPSAVEASLASFPGLDLNPGGQ